MDWRTRSKGCGPTRRNTRKVSNGCWPNWQQNRGSVWYRSSSTPSTQQPPDEDKNLIIKNKGSWAGGPDKHALFQWQCTPALSPEEREELHVVAYGWNHRGGHG